MSNPSHNRLAVLAADIKAAHLDVARGALVVAERAISAGHMLIEAKAAMPHGDWGVWLAKSVGISARSARRYMQLARSGMETATVAEIGIKGAAKRLAHSHASVLLPQIGFYASAISYGEGAATIWRDREQSDRFHVAVYVVDDTNEDHLSATNHPVPAELVPITLKQSGFANGWAAFELRPIEGQWPELLRNWAMGNWPISVTDEEHEATFRAIRAVDADHQKATDALLKEAVVSMGRSA